ncbi:hypothetical protein HDV05_000967 [Chytridiales sp. JEL 0842]|nr:hypothetical protein HDV05_000967 [Chytridiales sp. JEL 0842]
MEEETVVYADGPLGDYFEALDESHILVQDPTPPFEPPPPDNPTPQPSSWLSKTWGDIRSLNPFNPKPPPIYTLFLDNYKQLLDNFLMYQLKSLQGRSDPLLVEINKAFDQGSITSTASQILESTSLLRCSVSRETIRNTYLDEVLLFETLAEDLESLNPSALKVPWDAGNLNKVFEYDFQNELGAKNANFTMGDLKTGSLFVKAVRLNFIQRLRLADVAQSDVWKGEENVGVWRRLAEGLESVCERQEEFRNALKWSMKEDLELKFAPSGVEGLATSSKIPKQIFSRLSLLDNIISEVKLKLLIIAEELQGDHETTPSSVFAQMDAITLNILDFQTLLKDAKDFCSSTHHPSLSNDLSFGDLSISSVPTPEDDENLRDGIHNSEMESSFLLEPPTGVEDVYEGEWGDRVGVQEKKMSRAERIALQKAKRDEEAARQVEVKMTERMLSELKNAIQIRRTLRETDP